MICGSSPTTCGGSKCSFVPAIQRTGCPECRHRRYSGCRSTRLAAKPEKSWIKVRSTDSYQSLRIGDNSPTDISNLQYGNYRPRTNNRSIFSERVNERTRRKFARGIKFAATAVKPPASCRNWRDEVRGNVVFFSPSQHGVGRELGAIVRDDHPRHEVAVLHFRKLVRRLSQSTSVPAKSSTLLGLSRRAIYLCLYCNRRAVPSKGTDLRTPHQAIEE